MEIAIIVLCSLLLILGVVAFVVFYRKNKFAKVDDISIKELGSIEKQIEDLAKENKMNIELALSKEMLKLAEANNKSSESNNEKLERFQKNISESINTRFDALSKQVTDRLLEMNKKVDDKLQEGFKGTSETMTQVRERLQAIDDAQKNIESLGKDVISLKQVLEGNQSRGQYGEYQLKMVLHNVFGDVTGCYQEQYTMKKVKDGDDVRADAVVFMPEPNKMICIDSKFPFKDYSRIFETEDASEKETLSKDFSRAVMKHITDIKDKYIIENKTSPEAIMFIPNDGVFAFIHQNLPEVVEYAREKKVILTSPSTLPPILVTINMVRIESERAKNLNEISKQLGILGRQFEQFSKEWDTFSRQLETATRSREKLDTRVNRITGKFDAIKGNSIPNDDEVIEISNNEEQ